MASLMGAVTDNPKMALFGPTASTYRCPGRSTAPVTEPGPLMKVVSPGRVSVQPSRKNAVVEAAAAAGRAAVLESAIMPSTMAPTSLVSERTSDYSTVRKASTTTRNQVEL